MPRRRPSAADTPLEIAATHNYLGASGMTYR